MSAMLKNVVVGVVFPTASNKKAPTGTGSRGSVRVLQPSVRFGCDDAKVATESFRQGKTDQLIPSKPDH